MNCPHHQKYLCGHPDMKGIALIYAVIFLADGQISGYYFQVASLVLPGGTVSPENYKFCHPQEDRQL